MNIAHTHTHSCIILCILPPSPPFPTFFVNIAHKHMHPACPHLHLSQEEDVAGLLKEDEDVAQRRRVAKEHERVLLTALKTIEDSRNFRF